MYKGITKEMANKIEKAFEFYEHFKRRCFLGSEVETNLENWTENRDTELLNLAKDTDMCIEDFFDIGSLEKCPDHHLCGKCFYEALERFEKGNLKLGGNIDVKKG